MAAPSELAVLMALRVRGRAAVADVARTTGCGEAATAAVLDRLRARGALATAPPACLTLTDTGRAELASGLGGERLDRGALVAAYERFEVVDADLKSAISGWQLADAVGKASALAGVVATASRAVELAAEVARLVPRCAGYATRVAAAAHALRDGDARFVANPRVDSLHQAWFELHEDMLVTLGRSRAA
jgi:hypothetical protein